MQTFHWGEVGSVAIGAYLLGCFTTGYYLVSWRAGQDLRKLGSGTVGARNAGRALGWSGFLLAMLGDAAKGALAVSAALYFSRDERLAGLGLVLVVAGHIWPAQLRFHGGKGIATSLGGLLLYDYRLALAVALSFSLLYPLLRKPVLTGLLAFACLPFLCVYLGRHPATLTVDAPKAACVGILAALVVAAHRKNFVEELSQVFGRSNLPKQHPPEL